MVSDDRTPAEKTIRRLKDEVMRLTDVLSQIDGGDHPCQDEALLRQWAYECITLGRSADMLSKKLRDSS